ncbi:MAG TPA: hypothetical protein VNG13_08530 [Mycobacteriales bacterium]|nr:hypothetical protein [Mycobacteriales bacterium]
MTDRHLAILRGGSRDGDSTTLATGVERLYAGSDAPGLVDVYEPTGETASAPGNPEPGRVYVFVGQEPIGELAPDMLHLPPPGG